MKTITIILFFILGILTYLYFPKDMHIEVPDSSPRVIAGSEVINSEQSCATVQDYITVDGQIITGDKHMRCNQPQSN